MFMARIVSLLLDMSCVFFHDSIIFFLFNSYSSVITYYSLSLSLSIWLSFFIDRSHPHTFGLFAFIPASLSSSLSLLILPDSVFPSLSYYAFSLVFLLSAYLPVPFLGHCMFGIIPNSNDPFLFISSILPLIPLPPSRLLSVPFLQIIIFFINL